MGVVNAIVIIGFIPPPYGGVSVHILRLISKLLQSGKKCTLITSVKPSTIVCGVQVKYSKCWVNRYMYALLNRRRNNIYHFHTMWNDILLMLVLCLLKAKIVSTMHDNMLYAKFTMLKQWKKWLVKIAIRYGNVHYIAVSEGVKNTLVDMGVESNKVCVIPAYIKSISIADNKDSILHNVTMCKHSILVYGWKIAINAEGLDVYGFDVAAKVMGKVCTTRDDIGMVFLVPNCLETDRYIASRLEKLGVMHKCIVIKEPIQDMDMLYAKIQLYLRPTITDGDSVMLRECLEYGIPVIASNLVKRPEGTIAVEHCVDSYVNAILSALDSGNKAIPQRDHYQLIEKCYEKMQ